ncbi:hypothetical protein TanjilG_32786 [Lupinus angustifolius]|uniref:peptidyl-tRNA hydrolase n=1 Tax=Lupinus angustifolius TaxID=3871 RepID=A0A4P1RFQ0_LUPAN|nr:hypothetical protein TanjilG_32786 [Lupinus angustifolius]
MNACAFSSMNFPRFHRYFRFSKPLTLVSPSSSSIISLLSNQFSSPITTDTASNQKNAPWLIVGLGNPGKTFNATRHNVGFEMVDAIAEAEGISMNSVSFKALFGKGYIGDVPVILAKPQTFMNLSGQSIFDDLDLPFAKLRLLPKGGHGGHNG